jgi:hypothetical protein
VYTEFGFGCHLNQTGNRLTHTRIPTVAQDDQFSEFMFVADFIILRGRDGGYVRQASPAALAVLRVR